MKGHFVPSEEDDSLTDIRSHPKLGHFHSFGNDVSPLMMANMCKERNGGEEGERRQKVCQF